MSVLDDSKNFVYRYLRSIHTSKYQCTVSHVLALPFDMHLNIQALPIII